jgi:hypothetical protein
MWGHFSQILDFKENKYNIQKKNFNKIKLGLFCD